MGGNKISSIMFGSNYYSFVGPILISMSQQNDILLPPICLAQIISMGGNKMLYID